MLQRLEKLLSDRRAPLWLAIFAIVLCLPALRFGLQADDWLFRWKVERGSAPWFMFEFDPAEGPATRASGMLVWWASPELAVRFLRPLASLSHALDFTLWPDAARWMRFCNGLIYAASVLVAAQLYRRFAPSLLVAGLAGLLYAVDEGHAFSTGWIAGRNTLLASLFALLALALHARARESGRALFSLGSCASVALALGSAEAGVSALSLLVAYALVMEPGSLLARLRTLLAPLGLGLCWAVIYVSLGCGVRGSSLYRELSSPLSTSIEGLLDLPIWVVELFGPSGYPFSLFFPALWVRLGALPVALGLLTLLWPALRASRACRFFALATLLSLAPLLCTLPTGRVLIGPSFGALGWVACAIDAARAQGTGLDRLRVRVLLGIHLVLALLMFVPTSGGTQGFANGSAQLVQHAQRDRELIVLATPMELLSNFALLELDTKGRTVHKPRAIHQLYTGQSALRVERIDARTLDMEVARGWGYNVIERVFCRTEQMPRAGSEVRLPSFTARVLSSTPEGMPQRVRFIFPTALEDPARKWLVWRDKRVVPWQPPTLGAREEIAPISFMRALDAFGGSDAVQREH
ncbi:MAG TPA: hypothetical protein VMF89_03440 [Polyangiales bacterium]|nr:hypothetical protein [Polyangiales bacterium]